MRYRAPLFNLTYRYIFFRVGLCPTRFLPFAGDVDAQCALDLIRTAEIAWTRVHAILITTREVDLPIIWRRVEAQGA